MKKATVIGLTGGIGAGKSEVAAYLCENYAAIHLELDGIARQLMVEDERIRSSLTALFGVRVYLADGTIDRAYLSSVMFNKEENRKKVNAIVHPRVKEKVLRLLNDADTDALYLIESAVFYDDHYEQLCDEVWYIRASEEIRSARLLASRPYTSARVAEIMAAQDGDAFLLTKADVIIENGEDFERTKDSIDREIGRLLG